MIRVLTEGVRRAELVQIRLDDLPADLIARPYIRVVPLKGARAADEGRIVPLTLATAKAIVTYLRARQSHGRAQTSRARRRGRRPDAADGLAGPGDAGPVRGRPAGPASDRGQAAARRDVLTVTMACS
jgi:integrase